VVRLKKAGGGAGAIWYEDKTFTIATHQDQWLCVPMSVISPAITTCKGSRGGCSDEALEEIKSIFEAQKDLANESYFYKIPKMNPSTKPLRYLSVCSGMEAATVAWHHMGWTPVGFSEIEPFPSQILKHHYPTIPNYGDLTKFKEWPIERGAIDLLVGGTPCQAFSVAGLRQGLADPRGNLALTFLALADHLRPKYILWENVPGVLSSSKGEDFASFISALAELRYGFAWRVCDAQHFGVPQRRKRIFLLAIEGAGNWRTAAEILFERKSLCGDIEESDQEGESITSDAGASSKASRKWPADIACTLNASFGNKQGLENQHALGGGSLFVPAPICMSSGQANAAIAEDKAHTLNATHETQTIATTVGTLCARDYKGVGNQYVQEGKCIVENLPKIIKTSELRLTGKITEQETCPTLTAGAKGGDSEPLAITFQPGNLRRDAGADPSTQATTTLKATPGDQMPHIAYAQGVDLYNQALTGDLHCPLRTAGGHGAPAVMAFDAFNQTVSETSQTLSCSASDVNHTGAVYSPTMAVRRLTPRECERLQGFPDDYSMIPWKGKPASECPDGPRYKACGNSMAVPVMRWIGERIQKQIDGTLNK